MSSIFLPLIFLPTRLLIPAVAIKGRKMGGRKMKSKSNHQFFGPSGFAVGNWMISGERTPLA
jgi:hypothetical protein